ncbi:MAG: molecular chaperone HtpG [Desulfocucumaceae bacterium]
MEFQAEVKQLLDIVINSLYTEKEIFVRELISNASDALEKVRLVSLIEGDIFDKNAPLEIAIETNDKEKILIVSDSGLGMTREELIENLGTIAHSGSKEFLKKMTEGERKDTQLIGQFGVGFYSAFMVASFVRVQTRSYRPDAVGLEWSSDGTGVYSITPMEGLSRGTRIIITLKEDAGEFAEGGRIKSIIKQYSNFVPFDIALNGEKINIIQAIWTRNKNEIKEEEYNEFYKFLTNAFTDPIYRLHLSSDAPIQINALFFIPGENLELFGLGRLDPGVNLYSRKVLIQPNSREILPEYMRFVKGVVDSEDLPLNISRETVQNTRLIKKMSKFLTRRVISFLEEEASKDKDKYLDFWGKFSMFIKEGCISDPDNRVHLARLLRFESSKADPGAMVSLADYVSRMKDEQKSVYYINGPSRESIEAGPYLEAFRQRDAEVLYLVDPVDDFVMTSLLEFDGKKLISADQSNLDLPSAEEVKDEGEGLAENKNIEGLTPEETGELAAWMKDILGDAVSEVRESRRLVDSPAVIVNPDRMMTTSMQRVLQAANKDFGGIGPKVLEINSKNKVIVQLARLRGTGADEELLRSCVEQVADNAFMAAGLPGNRLKMVDRIYKIMAKALS